MKDRMTEFEEILSDQGAPSAYAFLTGRPEWADKLAMLVPTHMQAGWTRWAAYGPRAQPGGFLQAVVNNDLFEAFGRADVVNAQCMEETCRWLYNYTPAGMRDGKNWKGLLSAELAARKDAQNG